MKRLLSIIMVLALTLALFSGCGSKKEASNNTTDATSTPAAATEAAKPSEKVKLVMWHYFQGNEGQAIADLVTKFNSSQDKIEVVQEFLPREELIKQYTMGLVAEKLPDIGMVDNPEHASFAAMGLFEDISDLMSAYPDTDKFFKGPLKSTIYEGKNYGIPLSSNCLALYYNEDMLKEAGVEVPETWDELKEAAKKLTKNGVYGLAICAVKNEEGTFQYLPWLLSAGANIEKLDSPEAVKSMQFLSDLVKDGSMSKEVINWTQADAEKQFATGKAAMMINGPWNIAAVKADGPNIKWNVAKVPKDKEFASVLGGENVGIIKGKNKEAGWEFLKFISDPKNMDEWISKTGYFPPRQDVAENSERLKNDPILKVFIDQMQFAMPRGPHPKWPQISDAMSTAMQESFTNAKTPEQAAKDAQVKIDGVLK
jgi:multiple sugar transport system substrate-binding protein